MESRYPTTGRLLALIDGEVKKLEEKVAQHYEPKLVFDPTPVYSVTLAEDIPITAESLYSIPLPPGTGGVWLCGITPAVQEAISMTARVIWDNGGNRQVSVPGTPATSSRTYSAAFFKTAGTVFPFGASGSASSGVSGGSFRTNTDLVSIADDESFERIDIGLLGPGVLPAGMTITVYAATEV